MLTLLVWGPDFLTLQKLRSISANNAMTTPNNTRLTHWKALSGVQSKHCPRPRLTGEAQEGLAIYYPLLSLLPPPPPPLPGCSASIHLKAVPSPETPDLPKESPCPVRTQSGEEGRPCSRTKRYSAKHTEVHPGSETHRDPFWWRGTQHPLHSCSLHPQETELEGKMRGQDTHHSLQAPQVSPPPGASEPWLPFPCHPRSPYRRAGHDPRGGGTYPLL